MRKTIIIGLSLITVLVFVLAIFAACLGLWTLATQIFIDGLLDAVITVAVSTFPKAQEEGKQ